jgi:hypothetical protein
MPATQSQTVPPAEAVRSVRCQLCRARPAAACTPRGDHLARWLAASSAGRITRDALKAAIVRLVVVTRWCVVTDAAEFSQDGPA